MEKDTIKTKMLPQKACLAVFMAAGLLGLAGLCLAGRTYLGGRNKNVMAFLRAPEKHPEYVLDALSRCGEAPFLLPSRGFVG